VRRRQAVEEGDAMKHDKRRKKKKAEEAAARADDLFAEEVCARQMHPLPRLLGAVGRLLQTLGGGPTCTSALAGAASSGAGATERLPGAQPCRPRP